MGSVICQLLSTFERSGCSKGNAITFFCSGRRLFQSAAASVSDDGFVAAPVPAHRQAGECGGHAGRLQKDTSADIV